MEYIRLGRVFAVLTLILAVFPAFVSAMTWYVDPANGSDSYTGDSPFARPEFGTGPKKTLEGVVSVANDYDMVVLMDGTHAILPFSHTLDDMGQKCLYVCSANGPENCTIRLGWHVFFSEPAFSDLPACFDGITFASTATGIAPDDSGSLFIGSYSRVEFKDCVFTGFRSRNAEKAFITIEMATTVFEHCTFMSNDTITVLNCMSGKAELENCQFTENTFGNLYANQTRGLVHAEYCSLLFRDCTFTQNSSASAFIAVSAIHFVDLQIQGCVIENNRSTSNADLFPCIGIWTDVSTQLLVSDTRFENLSCEHTLRNQMTVGIYGTIPDYLNVWNCKFTDVNRGILVVAGTGMSDIDIGRCDFVRNEAKQSDLPDYAGAGIYLNIASSELLVSIRECTFNANDCGIHQEGDWVDNGRVVIENCLFINQQGVNATIELLSSSSESHLINHCTIADNGMSTIQTVNTRMKNSIFRSNFFTETEGLTIDYCNVQNWTGAGVGNIDVDPLFAAPGYWDDGRQVFVKGTDYHLKSTAGRYDPVQNMLVNDDVDSPCIDAGDPADVPFFEPTGSGGRVNMGVYGNTWQASMTDVCFGSGWRGSGMMFSDINNDCVVNLADYAVMASEWLDSTLAQAPILY